MKKQTKRILKKTIIVLFILPFVFGACYFGYWWWQYHKAKFTHYPEFGIAIPNDYTIHGIDVSRYQQMIAWEEVKAMRVGNIHIDFCFIKATEGIGNSDAFFNRNWRQCKEAGLVRGAYHFFLPTKDGKMQAENFIKIVNLRKGDLPPVLDIEQTYGVSKIQLQREALKWLQTVEGYYKVKPIIYTNVDFYKNNLGDNFNEYPLWVAHYLQPREPRIKRDWVFWQHNEQGKVNGILTNVDFNVFSGDSTDFQKLRIQ